jgi:phosphatidylglycerophosphatase A
MSDAPRRLPRGDIRTFLVTVGGAGLLRPAPGTWGSAATILIFFLIDKFFSPIAPLWWNVDLLIGLALASVLSVKLAPWAIATLGRKDPSSFVLDEAGGICVSLIALPIWPAHRWFTFLIAFAAFRLFDVTKPSPARNLEKLPAGWGILLDDLAAGLYANLLCQLVLRWLMDL